MKHSRISLFISKSYAREIAPAVTVTILFTTLLCKGKVLRNAVVTKKFFHALKRSKVYR